METKEIQVQFTEPQNNNISDLISALCEAQKKLSQVTKDREVKYNSTSFRYATLDAIIEHVRKPLADNGLWFVQTIGGDNGKYSVTTTLYHKSGQSISSIAPINATSLKNQDFGSALTYMKRYSLSAMLGVAADDDDDGNAADNTGMQSRPREVKSATGFSRTMDKDLNKWVNDQLGVINTIDDLEGLREFFLATVKEAKAKGCTEDQITLIEQQKDSRKDFINAKIGG
jgi:hypothetical protein